LELLAVFFLSLNVDFFFSKFTKTKTAKLEIVR